MNSYGASINYNLDSVPLDDEQLVQVTKLVIGRLKAWLRKESIKQGKALLKIKSTSLVRRRFLTFGRGKQELKLWIGKNPLGVESFGNPVPTGSGVSVGSEHYDGAFINFMGSDTPLVWRRKTGHRKSIERVTKPVDDPDAVITSILSQLQEVFDRLLEEALHEVIR